MIDRTMERMAAALVQACQDVDPWERSDYLARAALDAAMPLVETVEAALALPIYTLGLGRDGNVFWPSYSRAPHWRGHHDGYDHALSDILPLRVLWTPGDAS